MTNTELISIRESLNMSKTEFARKIGISPVMEGKYEKGSKEIPDEVIREVNELMESTSVEEEKAATPVMQETYTPVAEEETAVSVVGVECIVEENTTPVVEKAPVIIVSKTETSIDIPFILPLAVPAVLFGIGLIMRPGRWMRIYGPWV